MFWLIAISILVVLFWYLYVRPLKYWSEKGVKQTRPWPLFGDSWMTILRMKSVGEWVEYVYNQFPNERYFGMYQFTLPTLVINDLDLIKQIAIKDFDHFTDHRGFVDNQTDPLLAGNLFSLKGQRWREMRATLSGTFTSSKMKSMYGLMTEASSNFAEYFLNKNENEIELEMKDTVTRYTNDVIASAVFGVQVDSLKDPNNRFYQMGRQLTNINGFFKNIKFLIINSFPKIAKWLKFSPFDAEATEFFRNVLMDTIKTREEKGIVRPDVINVLLEARKGIKTEDTKEVETGFATVEEFADNKTFKAAKNLTDTDIAAQAIVFFFAGFDTIATGMCFGLYELAVNTDVQDKLRREIKETDEAVNGKITYETLLRMKYLDMVVTEMMRKWTPAILTDRVCTKPYTIEPVNPGEKPLYIKKGELLFFPIQGIHRNPNLYPNPTKFDPERFSAENKDNIVPYSYLPFGVGPRNCIGSRFALLEMKALFYKLLLNFEILPTAKTTIPLKLNRKSLNHTAANGFWFRLKRVDSL